MVVIRVVSRNAGYFDAWISDVDSSYLPRLSVTSRAFAQGGGSWERTLLIEQAATFEFLVHTGEDVGWSVEFSRT